MPSGHVAIVTFAALAVVAVENAAGRLVDRRRIVAAVAIAMSLSVAVAVSRVMRHCHTPLQTLVGMVLGAATAAALYLAILCVRSRAAVPPNSSSPGFP
jgi:membrane-associated phospholipid phosphatase